MFQYFHARHLSLMPEIPLYLDLSKSPREVAQQAGYLASTIDNHPYQDRFILSPTPSQYDFYTDGHAVTCLDKSHLRDLEKWLVLPETKTFMAEILFVKPQDKSDVFHVLPLFGESEEQYQDRLSEIGVSPDATISLTYQPGYWFAYPLSYMGMTIAVSAYVSTSFLQDLKEWLVLTALESP